MTTKQLIVSLILVSLTAGIAKQVPVADQAYMIIKTAEKYHYSPKSVNDSFSEAVYKSFLNMLDPYGVFFTEEIIGELGKFKHDVDDQIKQKKTTFLETAAALYVQQLHLVDSSILKSINKDIDISVKDTLWLGDDAMYGKQRDLKRRWEQWIKYLTLWSLQTDKDSIGTQALPDKKEVQKILNEVLSRETCRMQLKMNPAGGMMEFTGLTYLKAISMAFDPHTEYMSFAEKKQWETYLSKESGSFGIRVNFNIVGEIEIIEVEPGGPAWRSNKINEGDVILDIRKPVGTTIDLRCSTLSAVHDFLDAIGNKQTIFKIRKKSGKIIQVSLKKQKLDVEENTIRSYVLKEDFDKILDMEDIAAQSYDQAEAHQLAIDLAVEKQKASFKVLNTAEDDFFKKYHIKVNETKDELTLKIEKANKALDYYNAIYRIFFKVNKQDRYARESAAKKDIAGLEQHTTTLFSFADEGLEQLKQQKAYEGDSELLNTAIKLVEFYKQEGEKTYPANIDFSMKVDNFQNISKKFNAIKQKDKKQEDVDEYNKAVNLYNKAVADMNKINNISFKTQKQLIDFWNKQVDKFLRKHS